MALIAKPVPLLDNQPIMIHRQIKSIVRCKRKMFAL